MMNIWDERFTTLSPTGRRVTKRLGDMTANEILRAEKLLFADAHLDLAACQKLGRLVIRPRRSPSRRLR